MSVYPFLTISHWQQSSLLRTSHTDYADLRSAAIVLCDPVAMMSCCVMLDSLGNESAA